MFKYIHNGKHGSRYTQYIDRYADSFKLLRFGGLLLIKEPTIEGFYEPSFVIHRSQQNHGRRHHGPFHFLWCAYNLCVCVSVCVSRRKYPTICDNTCF